MAGKVGCSRSLSRVELETSTPGAARMKGWRCAGFRLLPVILLSMVLVFTSVGCRPAPPPLTREEVVESAERFVALIAAGKHAEAVDMMDPKMRSALPASKLGELWSGLTSQHGVHQSTPRSRYADEAGFRVVYVTVVFAHAQLEIKVVFDNAGRVAGLWLGQPTTGTYIPPAYADTGLFVETEHFIESGRWRLPATLSMPKGNGPFPALVLVHGSGPHDRDGSVGPNRPFKDLAWGLASRGIAVLRYDKRTLTYRSELQASDLSDFTVDHETVDDAVAAVGLLRSTGNVDPQRVFVIGHSLGGMLAPRIAASLNAADLGGPPAGLILLAAPARDLLELIVEQADYLAALDGTVTAAETEQLRQLGLQATAIRLGNLGAGQSALGAHQAYWTHLLAYNQLETAKRVGLPMLILQGERDYQVTMRDFALWREAVGTRPAVTLRSFPALNHLFMAGEGPSNPAEYAKAGNVAQEVVEQIAAWIEGR